MAIPPPTIAGPPPASSPGAPRRPISSRWRLPSHRPTATALLRPNQSLILHRPGHHSRRRDSTPPPSPLPSNPHRAALPSRLPHPRDFVPWRLSDACRPRPPIPASPLGASDKPAQERSSCLLPRRSNEGVMRPLQKRLSLSWAAKDIPRRAVGTDLSGVTGKTAPPLDLRGVYLR
jgi:hypothetical protein